MLAIIINKIKNLSNMDHQSQFPISFFNFKNSDKNSDILSIQPSNSLVDIFAKKQPSAIIQLAETEITEEKVQEYFNLLFSPKGVAQSLIRRNQYLQMKCLEKSDSEPEQLYNRRKKRVTSLKQKQNKKIMMLSDIKQKQPQKFRAISKFMMLFGQIKEKIHGIRHDYYSEKTFLTLKKATPDELLQATKVLSQILNWVVTYDRKLNIEIKDPEQRLLEIYLEFLIIPRFFISKEKLMKLVHDETVQENFKLLILHTCLGHYNNEANKKLPQENHMKYVKELLSQSEGRERFKKICTINHGGNFFKKYNNLYYELYYKNLEGLKKIQQICKRKHTLEQLNEEMSKQDNKAPSQKEDPKILQNFIQDIKVVNWPVDIGDERSISQFLKSLSKDDIDPNLTKAASTLAKSTYIDASNNMQKSNKFKLKRPYSLMTEQKPKISIMKSFTADLGAQGNIILVHPPNQGGNQDNQMI